MVAVMVAVPGTTPVTVAVVPLPLTVATLVLLELYVMVGSPLTFSYVAVRVCVNP